MEARYLFIRRAISSFSCQYPPSVLFPDDVAPARSPSLGFISPSAYTPATATVRRSPSFSYLGVIFRLTFCGTDSSRLYASGNFLQGADQANFSVYVHSQPGFVFNEETTRSQYFYNRQLNNSINVTWGEYSMIAAERLLLSTALEDQSNQRFVLLSDSCAPLYDFGYIYRYLISSPRSFVDSFIHTKERRYSTNMSSVIPEEKWRKGSQWISVIRSHAELIVSDGIVFPVFEKFCKKAPPFGSQEARVFFRQNLRNCIPDEHYIQTLLTMRGLESEMEPRTLTYTVWNVSGTKHEAKSWHPVTFTFENSGPEDIQEIKSINHVNYESESRVEWCKADSKPVPCFLFARKFTREAAMRLVSEVLIGFVKKRSLISDNSTTGSVRF
ncbi:hypothetical protein Rs2_23622 [Raphanus sativus]|nr:hypothetical protein Rs2_23622 [Raphanus sativus]